MNPDERNMLNDLADKIAQTPAPPRDAEAEDLIRTKIGKRPDALYLMTQTVLIQNLALQRAQSQLQELQQRAGQNQVSGSSSSWLGQGNNAPGTAPPQAQYSAPPPPQYATPASASGGGPFGGGGFLRGAAQTAAGVAAGSLAAEAIGSMFGHHGGGFFGGGDSFAGGSGIAPAGEVVNNYYDSPGGDYRTNDAGLNDSGNNFVDPGDSGDTGSYDDNQFDDSSATDDGGGFDDNSGDNFV